MKTNLVRATLACAALAFTSTALWAVTMTASFAETVVVTAERKAEDAMVGADLTVKRSDGSVVEKMQTDEHGQATVKGLAPGDYVIEIDGPSFVAAMDRLGPPPPTKHDSGPSVSLGVGSLFGGGSHHSDHQGAGPTGGHDADSRTGSGGVGLGLSIPAGGSDQAHPSEYWVAASSLDYEAFKITNQTPYCRDAFIHGMRIGFTVRQGGSGPVTVELGRYIYVNGTVKL